MRIIRGKEFVAKQAWEALHIATLNGITVRLHWTDAPYVWHVNHGEEVFVVIDGQVKMFYRENGIEQSVVLDVGDIFHASVGTEHVAHPNGIARILVIEAEGSI